jgi:outer membrane protein assembly factor BamB
MADDRRRFLVTGACAAAGALLPAPRLGAATEDPSSHWPQWRGPLATGEGPRARPPIEWGEGRNVRFKIPLPGDGKSTPIIWKDLLVLTAALPSEKKLAPRSAGPGAPPADRPAAAADVSATQQFVVMALGREDGRLRWQRTVREEHPHEGTHKDGSFAAGSALTDGERLYAFFGSRGLFALDFEGKVLWEKDLGLMRTRNAFGEGSTPAVARGVLVVTWDHEGEDFVVAFDARTGREKWRKERDEPTTWATPLIVTDAARAQVVLGGTNGVRAHDLETGEVLWEAAGLTLNAIPSPVYGDGIVYAMSGFRGNALRAVRVREAKGLVSGPPGLVFTYDKDTPYVPSPLLYRGGLYFLKHNSGILTCLDAKTGASRWSERLDAVANVYASPVGADGRVYVVGREGATVVLKAGPQFEILATNRLDDGFDASPALVDGDLYLRGRKHLYRIAAS